MPKEKTTKKFKAAIVGGTGYGGAEMIRLLLGHPSVSLERVSSIDFLDEPLENVHLNLLDTGLYFKEMPLEETAEGMDVILLGLPHKVPATMAPILKSLSCKVVDMSGDFRLKCKDAYAKFYGVEHPHPEELDGRWAFGLPELYKEEIRKADRVASPGCFATTIMLSLLPLAWRGLLTGAIQTVAATGSSGSGAYAKPGTHHPVRANNMKIYKALNHQHTPEIEQLLNEAMDHGAGRKPFNLQFIPVSAPLPRGILANNFVRVPASLSYEEVLALYQEEFDNDPFIRVLNGRHAEVVAIKGSMYVDISLVMSEPVGDERQLVISTALDNLVKGGAGQAIQAMNLCLGLGEQEGIDAPALWP